MFPRDLDPDSAGLHVAGPVEEAPVEEAPVEEGRAEEGRAGVSLHGEAAEDFRG